MVEVPAVDFVLFTPTFTGIGGDLDLTSIQICDANGDIVDPYEGVALQIMDDSGAYTDSYAYSPAFYPTTGWALDGVEVETGEVTIPVGRAFCIANGYGDVVYMKVAGQVDVVNRNLIPAVDFVLWGNSTPVAIDLTDIQLVDAEGNIYEPYESIALQVMDETGAYTDAYAYSPAFYTYGWSLDSADINPGDLVIAPGASFCVINGSGEAVYMKLPNPTTYTLPDVD